MGSLVLVTNYHIATHLLLREVQLHRTQRVAIPKMLRCKVLYCHTLVVVAIGGSTSIATKVFWVQYVVPSITTKLISVLYVVLSIATKVVWLLYVVPSITTKLIMVL